MKYGYDVTTALLLPWSLMARTEKKHPVAANRLVTVNVLPVTWRRSVHFLSPWFTLVVVTKQ